MRCFVRRSSGLALVQILIASGLLAVMAFGVSEVLRRYARSTRDAVIKSNLINYRQNLANSIDNDDVWNITKNRNAPIFDCLKHNNCRNEEDSSGNIITEHSFKLYDAKGSLLVDAPQGISATGSRCSGFPSPQCPIQITLKWHISCQESHHVCNSELLEKVRTVVEYYPDPNKGVIPLTPTNYAVNQVRGQLLNTLSGSCIMYRGAFAKIKFALFQPREIALQTNI